MKSVLRVVVPAPKPMANPAMKNSTERTAMMPVTLPLVVMSTVDSTIKAKSIMYVPVKSSTFRPMRSMRDALKTVMEKFTTPTQTVPTMLGLKFARPKMVVE